MHNSDVVWAAGFFDGEGCIVLRKQKAKDRSLIHVLQLTLANTHRPALEEFCKAVGVGYVRVKSKSTKSWRRCWVWQTGAAKAAQVLQLLRPHLRVKRAEADVALAFRKLPRSRKGRGGKLTSFEIAQRERVHLQLQRMKRYEYLDELSGPSFLLADDPRRRQAA